MVDVDSLAQPEEQEQDTPEDEQALLALLRQRIKPPGEVEAQLSNAEELRRYVQHNAMLRDTDDAVGTNIVLRNMRVALNQFLPTDPQPRVSTKTRLAAPGSMTDADPTQALYAQTHEILIRHQQHDGGLKGQVNAAARAALTTGGGILKMRWQEDFTRDHIGYSRMNDSQDSVARYQILRMQFDEGKFDEESVQHKELRDLEPIVRKVAASRLAEDLAANPPPAQVDALGGVITDPQTGQPAAAPDPRQARIDELQAGATVELTELPEITQFEGPTWDVIDIEDFRWDWPITRVEDFYKSRWMAHRVFMFPEDVRDKWEIDLNEALREANFYDENGKIVKTSDEDNIRDPDIDQTLMGRRVAVWEYWDRVQFRVYTWIEGMNRFVAQQIPEVSTRRFFPFYPVVFDPIEGQLVPPSMVFMQKGLQDDYNKLRTWDQELLRASLPKFIIDKAMLGNDPAGLAQKLEEALPFSFTPVDAPGDLAASIFTVTPQRYDPSALEHTRQLTLFDSQLIAGIPTAALGTPGGASLATEAAISNEQMGVQTDARRGAVAEIYTMIYEDLIELNAQLLPGETVVAIAGEGAPWPALSTGEILSTLGVTAKTAAEDVPARRQELELLLLLAQVFAQMGVPVNPIEGGKLVAETAGMQAEASRLVANPALMQALQAFGAQAGGAQGQPGQQAQAPGERPQAQGGRGQEGGRPPIQEPPRPESVPNNPAA